MKTLEAANANKGVAAETRPLEGGSTVSDSHRSSPKPTRDRIVQVKKESEATDPIVVKPTLLKLKIGSSSTQTTAVPTGQSSKEVPKLKTALKQKKPKAVDMPPPPYVDDGSHDLLQEVIAMEEMGRGDRPASTSKPRKTVELDADDELLSLALNEPPKPPELKASPVPDHRRHPEKPLRKELPKMKKASDSAPGSLPGSSKGKEREASIVHATPSKPPKPSTATSTPINEKKCREVLKNLSKLPEYMIFSRPVDAIADGCPEYVKSCVCIDILRPLTHLFPVTTMKSRTPWTLEP